MYYIKDNNEILAVFTQLNGNDYKEYACGNFEITKINHNIISDEQTLNICFDNNIDIAVKLCIPRKMLADKGVDLMIEKGFKIATKYKKNFIDIVNQFEPTAKISFIHDKLGFVNIDGHDGYLAYNSVSLPVCSEYSGQIDIKPKGSIDLWLDMVKDLVMPYGRMMIALSIGFSSPLASMLKSKIDNNSLLFAFSGQSSSGKTTALRLIGSIFGKPCVGGMIGDFNDTEGYNIEKLASSSGYISLFDEASTNSSLTSFSYFASNGVCKGRLTMDGEMKEKKQWSGTIVITCEGSATDKTNQNEGVYVRMLEVADIPFTDSAEHTTKFECSAIYGILKGEK